MLAHVLEECAYGIALVPEQFVRGMPSPSRPQHPPETFSGGCQKCPVNLGRLSFSQFQSTYENAGRFPICSMVLNISSLTQAGKVSPLHSHFPLGVKLEHAFFHAQVYQVGVDLAAGFKSQV